MIVLLVLIALIVVLIWISPATTSAAKVEKFVPKRKKSVRFNSTVEVKKIKNDKAERFNPDLRDCVKRNTMKAMSVGGMKALAEIELSA